MGSLHPSMPIYKSSLKLYQGCQMKIFLWGQIISEKSAKYGKIFNFK